MRENDIFLENFKLPIEPEEGLLAEKAFESGGTFGYADNPYPCYFSKMILSEVNFHDVTIFYCGNGSGRSTLLNLISEKLLLNRIAPFNKKELFERYSEECQYSMAYDDEDFIHRIPNGCRIITSDDIFDLALDGARIYGLDSSPVEIKKWQELENTRIYFVFFNMHRQYFE